MITKIEIDPKVQITMLSRVSSTKWKKYHLKAKVCLKDVNIWKKHSKLNWIVVDHLMLNQTKTLISLLLKEMISLLINKYYFTKHNMVRPNQLVLVKMNYLKCKIKTICHKISLVKTLINQHTLMWNQKQDHSMKIIKIKILDNKQVLIPILDTNKLIVTRLRTSGTKMK